MHQTLVRAHRAKYDYSNSKIHGKQAYQIMIDLVGRDNEESHELIQPMVDVFSESEVPDGDALAFFFYLVASVDDGGPSWAGTHGLGSILRLRLKHNPEPHKASSPAAQSITILIEQIDDTVQKLRYEELLEYDQMPTIVNDINDEVELLRSTWNTAILSGGLTFASYKIVSLS